MKFFSLHIVHKNVFFETVIGPYATRVDHVMSFELRLKVVIFFTFVLLHYLAAEFKC